MNQEPRNPPGGRAAALCFFLAVTFAAALIGTLATLPAIPGWYAGLAKPWWTPPNAAFGPAWTILYVMMAFAAWRVWCAVGWRDGRTAFALYLVQLALNAAWSVLFFGLHAVAAALVDIAALIVAIVATANAFRRHSVAAAWLLAPYLLWVLYAATLNLGILQMNP